LFFFFLMIFRPLRSTLFPYTTLFRSSLLKIRAADFPAGNLRRDGQNRNAAPMGIIKSIDEMQVTRPTATRAHGQTTGQMRFINRSEEHTSELQSRGHLVCRLLLEKKN